MPIRSVMFALIAGLGVLITAQAAPMPESQVPTPLKPWIAWSLYGHDEFACPPAVGDVDTHLCNWPSQLKLELDARGGRFSLQAQRFAPGWIALPGGAGAWPQDTMLDGRSAAALEHDEAPAVYATAGIHRIEGRFDWPQLPESLKVPQETGLLGLSINGSARPGARRDSEGNVALGREAKTEAPHDDHVNVEIFRRIEDGIPVTLVTHFNLEAAGRVREQVLGSVLPEGFAARELTGDLPARIDGEGRLHVQLRPGVWQLDLIADATARPQKIERRKAAEPWPEDETWSFVANRELRIVEVDGGTPVDPRQTRMPDAWRGDPAFVLAADQALTLDEKQRGLADAPPDSLSLTRDLWLDYDGAGYTVQDRLGGTLSRTWRLDLGAPFVLGKAEVDGQPQLVTRGGTAADAPSGVEVRRSALNLLTQARIESTARSLPVSGWNADLQTVQTSLHLPPGWRLLAAPGTDNVPDSWLTRWTLLDLFLVLIASAATLRVFGLRTAALAVITLALTWHDDLAPHWSWIALVAAVAIVRALPESLAGPRLRAGLAWAPPAIGVVVALVAIPYFVQQARLALYPQLETSSEYEEDSARANIVLPSDEGREEESDKIVVTARKELSQDPVLEAAPKPSAPAPNSRMFKMDAPRKTPAPGFASSASLKGVDPGALTQTGPGLPRWAGTTHLLAWHSGAIGADQTFHLWLSPPWITRLLRVAAIALTALLLMVWIDLHRLRGPWKDLGGVLRDRAPASAAALVLALASAAMSALPAPAHAQQQATDTQESNASDDDARSGTPSAPTAPPSQLIEELRTRLTAPPDCSPACAAFARMLVTVHDERLTLRLTAEVQAATGVPLPVPLLSSTENGAVWQPDTVTVDGQPAALRHADDGGLWASLASGRHELLLSGSLAGSSQLQLPLPLPPQQVRVDAAGWEVSGIDEDGAPDSVLQLARQARETGSELAHGAEQSFPPLLTVTRTLHFGLEWTVDTQITRAGSVHTALVVPVALLPGEAVTGDAVRVDHGLVQAGFAPEEDMVQWTSRLPVTGALTLTAPAQPPFETWRLDIGPVWHVGFDGLAPTQVATGGQWLPTFQPWLGESVKLAIVRPAGAPGPTLTLERADFSLTPGVRATDAALTLELQSSQGGQHRLPLPEGASLQGLTLDGVAQPPRLEGGALVLPLHPGHQSARLQLRFDQGQRTLTETPPLALGLSGVNASLSIDLPENRWVLLAGGPRLGPAVLFWGVLAVLLLVAFALSRSRLTPLRLHQWLLLSIGLSQIPVLGAAVVAGWLFALGARGRYGAQTLETKSGSARFEVIQVLVMLLTVIALGLLAAAIARGLLGAPDMQVVGNGSTAHALRWFADRFGERLPNAWVLSVSIWWYRLLMLLWALWLANALLGCLRWGWTQFTTGGLWPQKRTPPAAGAPGSP